MPTDIGPALLLVATVVRGFVFRFRLGGSGLLSVAPVALPSRIDLNLRGDLPFIMDELVGVDLAVVIGVQFREEAFCVGLQLIGGQIAVMVPIGVNKPHSERVVAGRSGAERL